jgi:DNA-binding LytR/AlgR family response regulator
MLKYSCLIIEDEPLAAEVLSDYVKQVPFLDCKAICPDAIYAMEFLQREKVDLLFLDIHLPGLKGLEYLESMQHPPNVIITSAHTEYALQGFELNVLDYLLKPIRFNRFLKAVNKLNQQKKVAATQHSVIPSSERTSLFVNVGKKRVKVYLDEILYIESLRDYVKVITGQKSILTKFQLNEIEEMLSRNNFIRVHRSFIVAKDKITAFTAGEIEIDSITVPIGRSYKEMVTKILESNT